MWHQTYYCVDRVLVNSLPLAEIQCKTRILNEGKTPYSPIYSQMNTLLRELLVTANQRLIRRLRSIIVLLIF